MSNLIPSFKDSLFDANKDTLKDLLELSIDQIVGPAIEKIPVVDIIYGLGKSAIAIRDMNTIKQLVTFIYAVNNGDISQEKLKEHKNKLENNPKKLSSELELVIVLVDKQVHSDKTKILAELYKSYIREEISWIMFKEFTIVVEGLFLRDLEQYKLMYDREYILSNSKDVLYTVCMSRLNSLGVIHYDNGLSVTREINGIKMSLKARLLDYGKIFYECGLKNLIDNNIIDWKSPD